MAPITVHSFDTDWGVIRIASTEKGLAVLSLPGESKQSFDDQVKRLAKGIPIQADGTANREVERQIKEYLKGQLRGFTLPLDIRGTTFQVTVLRQVAAIPYGETRTYGEIARAIVRPMAFRAVGSANAKNPLPLVIPCHRVVAAGGLGGYGGGLALKKKLLELEGVL